MLCVLNVGISKTFVLVGFTILLLSEDVLKAHARKVEVGLPLEQPQIVTKNGHIYFIPATNKNVILKTGEDGKIIFNDVELKYLVGSIQNTSTDLDTFKTVFGAPSSQASSTTNTATLEQSFRRLNQIDSIEARISLIEENLTAINSSVSGSDTSRVGNRLRRLKSRVEAIESQLSSGISSSQQNPCSSAPCRNGGTCIPTVYGAFCYCSSGWEVRAGYFGDTCNIDVNECANFAGTELGCLNGASCINTPGSYMCQCINGYIGTHCTKRSGGCSSASSWELCGHGICVDRHEGSSPYICICDSGWERSSHTPACTTDIDECTQHHTCSVNPAVTCVNIPGSYVCGPCPYGYTGNGHQCTDINECLINNGGCSVNPMVQCTNTIGSRNCGPCPPGYMGNGMSCQYVGLCNMNNGGCHPLARCVDNAMISQSFVQCTCPAGYTGTGLGIHGCAPLSPGAITIPAGSTNLCNPNPCQNGGICHPYGASYSCVCLSGFMGPTCSTRSNPCMSQPCQNGGTCHPNSATQSFTCACSSDFTGTFCERQAESCGGYITQEDGTLKYPQIESTYGHNIVCEWTMRTISGKVLNLTFTSFNLEAGSRCQYDYLEIRDGADSAAPSLGRFCGDELPLGGTLVSTHNLLHLAFRSDHNVYGIGFEFSWNSTDPLCGGTIQTENQTHGSFKSPGYPGNYPHDRDCVWQIMGTLGKRLQLVFASFQLETHPNCSYDYVEVRDGLLDTSPIIEKLCNTTLPAPVTSSGSSLSVRFHSDDSSTDHGFLITYSEVPGMPGCGGMLTAATAVFSSPHYPQRYTHGLECDWVIRFPTTSDKVSLSFLSFDLESSYGPTCVYDYVEVRDGHSAESPLLGRFCGNNLPPTLRSTGRQMWVKFKSDESDARIGFSAKYEPVCGGEYTGPDGTLSSPFYPSNYPQLRNCIYVISQAPGKGINLQFLDFEIESGHYSTCHYDFVEIRDGDNENSTLIGHYCGMQSAPEAITSSTNYLWLRFKTDGSVENRGFLANYSTFDTGCGGILKSLSGTIQSPGHPETYPHGVQCMWVIRADPGFVIRLTWDVFNLEASFNCRYDSLTIYDNSTSFGVNNGSIMGRSYCGQELPPIKTSTGNVMTIIFKSDHSEAYDGFMATYRMLNSTTVCGGNYFTEYGMLTSPGYPGNYPNGKSCTWVITVPHGKQIELNVTDFELEDSSTCRYDYLEVRNGHLPSSPLIGKFCGGNLPPSIIPSFANSMYLKFRSDSSHRKRGFKIEWDGTSTGCGGTLTTPTGSITSPNYPSSYSTGIECVWKIQVNQGSAVQITVVDVDLDNSRASKCWFSRVEMFDGSSSRSPLLGRFCHEEHLVSVESTGSSVTIKFMSSIYLGSGRGFQLNYRTICNRRLKGFRGVIESPNYPNPYPHNRNCTWIIEASRGNKLNISFSHFDVEAPYRGNCSYDYVQVSESKRARNTVRNTTVLGTYCGNSRPGLITTNFDTASITFISDFSYAHNGFRLEWTQFGCGGRIIGDWSRISSPNYPRRYVHNVECIWEVTTAVGTRVELAIYNLEIERGHDCVFDGLEVYGGPDSSSPLLTRLCQTVTTTTTVLSHGNNMYIRFYSDDSVASKGFYGYIYEATGGCGGYIEGVSGYIHSPNYPGNYDHNDDCSWLIKVPNYHRVELTFEDFDVERHINCSYDHVAVYDGRYQNEEPLMMHCGNGMPDPPVVRSTGSWMLVRLKTDGSASGKGFKAKYEMTCGARISSSGTIVSPNFPGVVPLNSNCSWIIESQSPEDRVTLTFTNLDWTAREDNCNDNYIQVMDGLDENALQLYKACDGRLPPSLTSRGNSMLLHLQTGANYYGHGFRAIFSLSSSACGGSISAVNGSITSPNYPNGYPSNVECIWVISASPGNQVHISFSQFEIESSENCNSDFVEIHESDASGKLIGHFCGHDIPNNITAAEKLWILFRSDEEAQGAKGFWMDFSLVHGGELSGPSGKIASPMYPNSYSGTGTFTWRVTVNESYAIRISFDHFEFDSYNGNCEYYDTLSIYDGYDENGPILLHTCVQDTPDPLVSSGNVLFIKYNRLGWYNSFLLSWQQVDRTLAELQSRTNMTGCGGNYSLFENNATTLTSPGFPLAYAANLNCDWSLDAPLGYRIKLKVETLAVESYQPCNYDRVELFDGVRGLARYQLNKTLCQTSERNNTYLSSGRFLRIVFKTDQSTWSKGFNFTLTAECGGYIRESRATISSPNYPDNYVASNCIWKVVVRPGRTIRVAFHPIFDIYSAAGAGNCQADQLLLRNGATDESPFLGSGRFCGNSVPTANLETTGNHLYVHFISQTHGGKGFALTYEEVSEGCGGTVQLSDRAPDFTFMSPNFPQIPFPHVECEWIFTAPQEEAIQLDFLVSFDITSSPGCMNGGVEVRDGGTRIAPELGVFCGTMPGTQTSTGNVLYVRYYTDVAEPRTGFKAVAKIATCGGLHVSNYGALTSPGFPASYKTNLDCLWTLRVSRGQSIAVQLENLNLGENGGSCTGDKLYITEQRPAGDTFEPRNWTFCNQSEWTTIVTASDEIQVRFTSDGVRERNATGMGFKIRYWVRWNRCYETLTTPSGFIMSPRYPEFYPDYSYCKWTIEAPQGRRIRIEFIDFDLQEGTISPGSTERVCAESTFSIYQGTDKYNHRSEPTPLYNSTLCGSVVPAPVESTFSKVVIYFRSGRSAAHRGFKLKYTTELPTICGGILEVGGGIISSPNGTTDTPNTTNTVYCEWKTASDAGSANDGWDYYWRRRSEPRNGTTIVTLHNLLIPSWGLRDPLCSHGYLQISPDLYYQYIWRKLCGALTNEKIYLPGSSIHVEYQSADLRATFNMSYTTVQCGGSVHDTSENLTSLNYPSPYPPNTECIWVVDLSSYGSQLKLKFYDLDLDDHQGSDGCDRDYVLVRNGKYPSSPLLGKFCRSYESTEIIGMNKELWIEFHSDENSDGARRGFLLGLEEVENGCGGVLHKKNGVFTSPGRSTWNLGRYPPNLECEWLIESVPGYTVNLMFNGRFDLENSTNCVNDYIEVFQKDSLNWTSKGRFCGRQLPPPINTTSSSVRVIFRSNENLNGDGFKLFWYSPCGGVFREPNGIIRSAHYDNFNHSMHVNGGRFWSYMGWESTWSVATCDYFIQGENSEDYIMIQFLDPFEVQYNSRYGVRESEINVACPRVNVTGWQGNVSDVQYTLFPVSCGMSNPFKPKVARGSALIRYNYMPTLENHGFRVQYARFECGGEVTSERRMRSPGHPFTYTGNMNCTWVVKAPANRVVRFKFLFLDTEFHTSCTWDYVRLYNGPLIDESQQIGTYCGNMTRDLAKINSRTNSMTIQFVSDSIIQGRGFEGAVEFAVGEPQGCGGTKNITAGNFVQTGIDEDGDGKYDNNLDCQWLLIASEFKSIEITFSSFQLEDSEGGNKNASGSCPLDYLEFRDGPGPHAQVLAKLCGSTLPAQIISSSNFVWVRFHTDSSINFPGFRFTASERPNPCGVLLLNTTSSWQYLTSPNYPLNYENNVRCRWRIDGSQSHEEVDIQFIDLDIQSSDNCNKDRLEIRDWANSYSTPEGIQGPALFIGHTGIDWRFRNLNLSMETILKDYKYCGNQIPPDFITSGRSAEIIFHSDQSSTSKGFKIAYKTADCNRTYTNSQGRIFSPEWPTYTPLYSNCYMQIRAPNATSIALYFNTFSLPTISGEDPCADAAFQIRTGSSVGALLTQYCGSTIPNPVFSTTNTLFLRFFNRIHPARGYDITYITTDNGPGCGGNVFNTGGSLTSPMYPGNYPQDKECVWTIRVPGGLRVQITFTNFMFGGECETNFLEISALDSHEPSGTPTLFTRYCPEDVPAPYIGSADTAIIRYKTSRNNTGTGWRLVFKGVFSTELHTNA